MLGVSLRSLITNLNLHFINWKWRAKMKKVSWLRIWTLNSEMKYVKILWGLALYFLITYEVCPKSILSTSIKYRRFRKKYNSILCGVGKKLNFSRRVWCEQYEPKKSTHHTRRKFNFDRLLYIIFFMTQIHRVRFASVNGEASPFFRIFFF